MNESYPPIIPASLLSRPKSFEWLVGRVLSSTAVVADEEYEYTIEGFPRDRKPVIYEDCPNVWKPFGDNTKIIPAPADTRCVVIILPGNEYECIVPEVPQYFDCVDEEEE